MSNISPAEMVSIVNKVSSIQSRRGRILESLRLILKTIDVAHGYTMSISDVSFDVNSWRDRLEGNTPIIYIVDDPNGQEPERHAGKSRFYKWNIILFGIVKGKDILRFEEHIADVQACLEDNGQLGGIASKTEVNKIVTDNQLFSQKEKTNLYEMQIQVEYVQCVGNPR